MPNLRIGTNIGTWFGLRMKRTLLTFGGRGHHLRS